MVWLKKPGTLYPTLHSTGKDREEDVDSYSIRSIWVNYRPGSRILFTMKDAGVKKTVLNYEL
ncbi:MAG: hypothetical protein LBL57_01400 [Tannerella sp.]|jgi:hypothetical protein|nr:hypothetical protein [Tannerella sp.]